MKERPILFNTEMVKAILDGRKTQTRRPLPEWQKPKQINDPDFRHMQWMCTAQNHPRWGFGVFGETEEEAVKNLAGVLVCPFGNIGDRLWVRETFALVPQTAYGSDVSRIINPEDDGEIAIYKAEWDRSPPSKWRPSIHMPRWASRLTLEITDVRVERLQDISEEDAKAEGFMRMIADDALNFYPCSKGTYKCGFAGLWNSLYQSWNENPWVWVVEFKVIK